MTLHKSNEKTTINSTAFTKHITSGQPTKYDKGKHISLLYNIFDNGEGIAEFCAETLISKQTFFNWLEAHREFKEAYDIVLNLSERKWLKYPLENRDINYAYWQSIMRNKFGYNKSRFKFSDDKTPLNIVDSVLRGLENGDMTSQEALQIANLALTKANIKADEVADNISQVKETRESLLDKIDKIQQIIDYKTQNKDQ